MTEEDWLSCNDPEPMLECLVTKRFPDAEPCNWGRGERKKRLFIFACVQRIWSLLPPEYKAAMELLEPEVDVLESDESRQAKWSAAERMSCEQSDLLFAVEYDDVGLLCHFAAGAALADVTEKSETEARLHHEHRVQTSLMRDIFGNPFRPVEFDPSWRTQSAVCLAQSMYDARSFDKMQELADALEHAGCRSEPVLGHCREPVEHVRGCWVVDLVLEKA